jgi:hypothetical protein
MMTETTVTAIGSAFRVARTAHVCACGAPIAPGTRYERLVIKVDGSLEVSKVADHVHAFEAEEAALTALTDECEREPDWDAINDERWADRWDREAWS